MHAFIGHGSVVRAANHSCSDHTFLGPFSWYSKKGKRPMADSVAVWWLNFGPMVVVGVQREGSDGARLTE